MSSASKERHPDGIPAGWACDSDLWLVRAARLADARAIQAEPQFSRAFTVNGKTYAAEVTEARRIDRWTAAIAGLRAWGGEA